MAYEKDNLVKLTKSKVTQANNKGTASSNLENARNDAFFSVINNIVDYAKNIFAWTNQSNTFSVAQTFSQLVTFSNTLRTNVIETLTSGANLLLKPQGAGKVYRGTATDDNEIRTKSEIVADTLANATAAANSEAAAGASATAAAASETKAEDWAVKAEDSPVETSPDKFSAYHWAQKSEDYKETAVTSAANAATSETNAATSATNAATSASNASTSASNASTSATNAATSETNASTSESNASTSASNASTSETNASNSASNASTSATNASNSASNASTSESNASTSATNAATSATNASTSETKAGEWATKAEDSPVETGPDKFSAFHWAQKAQAASAPMVGATPSTAGTGGTVPGPAAGKDDEVLFGDASWKRLTQTYLDYTFVSRDENNDGNNIADREYIEADTSTSAFGMNTPPSPTVGMIFYIKDISSTFDQNNFTLTPSGSDKIEGQSDAVCLTNKGQGYLLRYSGSTRGWVRL